MKRTANDPIQEVKVVNGVPVYIEWPKGSTRIYQRSGTKVLMHADYGYVPKTEGADGEELDVYVGDDLDSKFVFQLHQKDPDNEKFNENKYMIGFKNGEEAKETYLKHVPENRFGGMEEMSWDHFKSLLGNNIQKQGKEVTLDDSHLKDDIQDFNSLENKIEDMKNEDKQELKKQSSDSPPPWDYEPDPQNDPPESKYRAGQQVLLDNYKINGTYQNESAEGKILEAVFEEGAWSYRIELSPGDEVWALDDDINSVKTASRRRAMRTRRHAGGMLGSWLDEFSPEEIAAMPVQVVFMGPEGLTNKEYATIDEARQDHPDMTMNPMQAMHGGLYTDEFGPSGSPCLRFEDSEAYKTLSSSRRQAALTLQDLQVGDKVSHPEYGEGEVTYVGSGSSLNQVSVDFTDDPSSMFLGPRIISPSKLRKVSMKKKADLQVGDKVVFHGPDGDVEGTVYHPIEEHDKNVDVMFPITGEWDSCLINKVEKIASKKTADIMEGEAVTFTLRGEQHTGYVVQDNGDETVNLNFIDGVSGPPMMNIPKSALTKTAGSTEEDWDSVLNDAPPLAEGDTVQYVGSGVADQGKTGKIVNIEKESYRGGPEGWGYLVDFGGNGISLCNLEDLKKVARRMTAKGSVKKTAWAKPQETECEFSIEAEPEEMSPEGNASAIDEETDKAILDHINEQLEAGNIWAWCSVKVTCSWTDEEGNVYEGNDYLGGCSYENEQGFKQPGGYYDDMKTQAYEAMLQTIPAMVEGSRRALITAQKKVQADQWAELSQYLAKSSAEICADNYCDLENGNHNCESYAYIDKNGNLLDVCGSDYFRGSAELVAAIPMPWSGNPEELKSEVEEQTWDETEEEQGMDALGVSKYLRKAKKDPRGQAFQDEVQAATYGYQINMMDISKVYRAAEEAFDNGQNVTEAVHALLDQIATKTASCPPGLSKDVKDKVKKEYGPDDPRTYKTLWTIKDKQEGKKGSVKTADDPNQPLSDAFLAHQQACNVCQKAIMDFDPDALCPTGQGLWKDEIEGMGGQVTDPNYGKATAVKIGHEVFVRDLGIVASVKMIEGDIMTIAHPVFGEHYYVVGDDNIVRRRRRYATDEQEINDLERMKLKIEQQKKETEDEIQMQALEERLHELDMEIGRANAKQAMENPHFWDKVGEDIDGGNEKKLRSPATEEISERGHEEQEAHPSKGEPGEGTEYRHELAGRRTAKYPASTYGPNMGEGNYLHIWDSPSYDPTEDNKRVEQFNSRVQELMESGMSEYEAQHKAMEELPAVASRRRAEEATPPTLGGAPENVEQKIDSGEAKLAKDEDLDPDMFKDETQKKMEVNEDAVAGPKGKERDWNGGGYVSTSPSVGPSAMPGQEL